MPTLEEILEGDLGLGSEQPSAEKTASQNASEGSNNSDEEIEKLAMEIGLTPSNEGPNESSNNQADKGQSKEANMSLSSIYEDMFPGDADVIGGLEEKTASDDSGMDKEAAAREERIGEAAFDYFQNAVDGHLNKIAEELTGDATIDMDKDPDEEPDQSMASNKPGTSDQAIDTTPVVQDEVTARGGGDVVGHQEQRDSMAGKGQQQKEKEKSETTKQAAIRKHLLLLAMGQ